MKKILLLVAMSILFCGCDNETEEPPRFVETLAGSVSIAGSMEGEWTFDEVQLELSRENNFIDIYPMTDTYISLLRYIYR